MAKKKLTNGTLAKYQHDNPQMNQPKLVTGYVKKAATSVDV
jgi:hypothetical protein